MTPTNFPESNILMRGDHLTDASGEKIGNLNIYKEDGLMISCWKPTWRERFSMLFFGKLWLQFYTDSFPPVAALARKNLFVKVKTAVITVKP